MKKLCTIMMLGVLAFAGAAVADKYGDLTISPKTFLPPSSSYYHGYCEVTFQISNGSPTNGHVVTVEFPGEGSNVLATRTLRVDPGATVNCVLYLPASSYYNTIAKIEIDGIRQKDDLHVAAPSSNRMYYSYSHKPVYILRSRNVESAIADSLETKLSTPGSSDEVKVWRSESDIQNWSDNFLAYTPCDAVVIDAKDLPLVKPAVKEAIKRYVSAGGLLVICGIDAVSAEYGDVSLGFGRYLAAPANGDIASNETFKRFLNEQKSLQYEESVESMASQFPIVDMNRLPIKGMLIMLVIFSILIGPVLMIILSKYRKRIWMFWLVPLISLAACLGLFIFSVVSEGFTPTVKTRTLTILDENTNQATTIGIYGIYAPLTPGNGLTFSTSAELRDLARDSERQRKTIAWSKDQQLESGWVAARVPAYFNIRECQTRRERVNVKYKGDVPVSIVNGLGADIKKFSYCDARGNVYITHAEVPAGQEATLTQTTIGGSKIRTSLTDELRNAYIAGLWNISPSVAMTSLPETYRAELKGDPFISMGVPAAKLEQNCIVVGICRRNGNAD